MDYTKRPLQLQEQVDKLRNRGLIIDDEQLAKEYLSNISYYRLRAYTYPFQDNDNPIADHRFKKSDIHFSDIIDLYRFDRRLRSVIFNAIEKIEVAVRTKIVQAYAETTGDSHWFNDRNLYKHQERRDRNGSMTTAFDLLMRDIESYGAQNEAFDVEVGRF
jgi:abortive infection bacteriophage resistance protein